MDVWFSENRKPYSDILSKQPFAHSPTCVSKPNLNRTGHVHKYTIKTKHALQPPLPQRLNNPRRIIPNLFLSTLRQIRHPL
jgi:hypothetical protein